MLFGMDCLVQEVHIPRDVLVSEFDGRFGRSSAIAMGLRRCAVICNYGWSPGPSTQQDWQKAGPYDVLEPAWRGISGICRKRQLHCFTNKVHVQDEEQGALRLCRLRVLVIDWRCWGFWLNMPCSFCVCVHALANLYRLWASNVMLCKTSLDEYSTFLDMSLAQWCCSRFQQSILQWFCTPRPWSDWVQMSNPTFQGLDVFFWEMLAEHSCRWFDEADCMVRIVAQMLRVLIWWSISLRKQGCGWLEHKSFGKILVITVSVSSRWPSATRLSLFVQHLLWGGQRSRDGFAERKKKLGAHDGALRQRAVLPLHTVVRTNWFGEKPGGHVVCNVYILCRRWVIW